MPDYYTLLQQKIREAERDPAKLRALVYETARLALKRHVNVYYPAVSVQDGKRLLTDLEAAIERLETAAGGTIERPAAASTADKAAYLFEPLQQVFKEFDFRAAYEGRPADRAPTPDAAAAQTQELRDRPAPSQRSDPAPRPAEGGHEARPNPATRPPNRFSDRSRPGYAASRRPEPRRTAFARDEEGAAAPHLAPDPVGPPAWLDADGRPASRELVLIPDPTHQADPVATYVVRPHPIAPRQDDYFRDPPRPPSRSPSRAILIGVGVASQLAVMALAGGALYIALWGGRGTAPADTQDVAMAPQSRMSVRFVPAERPQPPLPVPSAVALAPTAAAAIEAVASAPAFPRPTAYGVYAISDNRLIELEPVATSPVDPRTRSILQITKPSRTIIVDPKLTFVAYRRDLISSAPDKVTARMVARVGKQMTFDSSGKSVTAPPSSETWLLRDVGYDLKVAPVRDNPEMVLLRPETEDFLFPPGRYAVVLGTQPYDFVIAGTITDPAQCVEGIATTRGPAFYECRVQ
jgi:hypothetical protein